MIDVDVAIIGGGPAGLAAAREAARAGMAVALVDPEGAGGRAAKTTTIPMRLLSRAAERGRVDWNALRSEILERTGAYAERLALGLEDAGVELVRGRARFESKTSLAVEGGRKVTFERAVIAAGAAPARLPGAEPDARSLFFPDQLASLPALPEEALVLGGGAAGAELADALSLLGTKVTWVMDELGLLPSFDRELAEAVGDVLMSRGVKLVHGKAIEHVSLGPAGVHAKLDGGRTYAAKIAFLAVGNVPLVDGLALEEAGVRLDQRGAVLVDESCATTAPNIFAAGDVTGRTWDVAGAEAMGRAAGRRAAGIEATFDPERLPRVAFTTPAIAQVGLSTDRAAGRQVMFHTLRLEETMAGHLARIAERPEAKGFVRLICASDDGRLLGATALGPGAADAVSAAALVLTLGVDDIQLAEGAAAVPSALEAIVRAVR